MSDLVRIKRALISVSDKADLIPFARALASRGVELISTGGTAKALADAGLPVTPIDQVTGFPEMLDGRVKTLHPAVHAGLLAVRSQPEHMNALSAHAILPIDLVCVSLYPFERTIAREGVADHEAIEQIDIGGPSMIRSGAKNFASVAVITSPDQYDRVVSELSTHDGCTTLQMREHLAAAAFARTSEYDATIAGYLGKRARDAFPAMLAPRLIKHGELRYGENPHQQAALYVDTASQETSIARARQLHGKQLGYNNILDAAAALDLVAMLKGLDGNGPAQGRTGCGACVVKHTNPCGCAVSTDPASAIDAAIAGDPLAAFGGILALNCTLDLPGAERITREGTFFEVVIAPAFEPAAADLIAKRWANVRILETGPLKPSSSRAVELRSITGAMLAQERDTLVGQTAQWVHAAGPKPDDALLEEASVIEAICRALSSNAIAIGGREPTSNAIRLFGAGAGQMDRVASCRIAIAKAGSNAKGAVVVSDAFFPFPDGPQLLADVGVRAIVHPGGSKRDQETLDLCDKHAITCLTTGVRHFRH